MELSSYMIFANWCQGKKLTKKRVEDLFIKRVEKSDWQGSKKGEIIDFLFELSNEGVPDKNSQNGQN